MFIQANSILKKANIQNCVITTCCGLLQLNQCIHVQINKQESFYSLYRHHAIILFAHPTPNKHASFKPGTIFNYFHDLNHV